MQKKYLPLVTIIMNVHNGEKFIQEAIKSIYISKKDLPILEKWSENPSKWGNNV